MHLIVKQVGRAMRETALSPRPFGPDFPPEEVAKAVRMEVWGTSVTDPGREYCLFTLFDAEDKVVAEREIGGY